MADRLNITQLEEALTLLGERLGLAGQPPQELIVCGGTSLIARGFVSRATRDVDVLARRTAGTEFVSARVMPEVFVAAATRVASDQPCVRLAGELAHISIQLGHAGLDELHPPVLAGQGVQDAAVKHKHAMHLGAALQGERERGVVGGAQVAPEPDQSSGVNGLHACR